MLDTKIPEESYHSEALTTLNGERMASAIEMALGNSFSGKLQLVGHSHGSKVVSVAAAALQQAKMPLNEVTLLDSPEDDVTVVGDAANYNWYFLKDLTTLNRSNPAGTFDYTWAAYDPFAIPMAKTAEQQGRDDIKISGYDASPDFVELIKQGGVAAATTAAPFEYAAWGAVDEAARMATGNDTWDATKLPVMLVTQDNADDPALEAGFFNPPFDYKAEFAELWGQG